MNPKTQPSNKPLIYISILSSLLKGFSVYYFLLLPILYALHLIQAQELGYIGALLVVGILAGAFLVTYKLHTYKKESLLKISYLLLVCATLLLFQYQLIYILSLAFLLIGLATGVGMSSLNALAAQFTFKGHRFKALSKIAMLTDLVRIIYPLIAGGIYALTGFIGLIYFALATVISYGVFMYCLINNHEIETKTLQDKKTLKLNSVKSFIKNKPFFFVMIIEFLDSFASSQLFVFLPALLIFKNFTIENALVMQSIVFVGYLCGRWIISSLASRFSGLMAVGVAEVGMVVTIILLITIPPSLFIYVLCFLLGLFSRGTSPVIKALAFDRLEPEQMQRGSAIHVIGGDSGSALGQFVFGLLLAWFGVTAPFVGGAICAGIVAIACFVNNDS